ncbi:MAG: MBL fold metallo-hydrolase [Candidatus Dormibacteria bacterium]
MAPVTATADWLEVGPGVLRVVGDPVNANCVLVVGRERALLVDTGSTAGEGDRLLAVTRAQVGDRQLLVANTHSHYDHCFGNVAFSGAEIWASAGCIADLVSTGEDQRRQMASGWRKRRPEFAAALEATTVVPAGHAVERSQVLDLGGATAELIVVGPGHTDHDLVVWLPELCTLVAGDLVEEGGPPAMEDSFPLSWPDALEGLLDKSPQVVVPGHGRPVGAAFVAHQSRSLRALADWCRLYMGRERDPVPTPPPGWSPQAAQTALRRARDELGLSGVRGHQS